jgi:hypothetical protein
MYTYVYIHIFIYICKYKYIYIYRERFICVYDDSPSIAARIVGKSGINPRLPLSRKFSTSKTAMDRFWPWHRPPSAPASRFREAKHGSGLGAFSNGEASHIILYPFNNQKLPICVSLRGSEPAKWRDSSVGYRVPDSGLRDSGSGRRVRGPTRI